MDAAPRASERDIEAGSFRNAAAVLRASCFCCIEVPWLGVGVEVSGGASVDDLEKWEPRFERDGV